MKTLPLLVFLCLPSFTYSQITFEPVNSPVDFSISAIRKSPIGEYFVQAVNDYKSIYTSMDSKDWIKTSLPISHRMNDIQFFSDGTPVLKNEYDAHLIRKNGIWQTMSITPGEDDVKTSFIKDDSLFVIQNETLAYSLDKGETFTTVFTFSESNIHYAAHLWKFEKHFVLHHTDGITNYLSVLSKEGKQEISQSLVLGTPTFTYNSCGEVLINDRDRYYLLEEQGLNFSTGAITDIIPNYSSLSDLLSQDGHYYLKEGSTIFKSTGCNFTWETLVSNNLISSNGSVWISPQEEIFLFNPHKDLFIESKGINKWEEHLLDIDYAFVFEIDESAQEYQIAGTSNALYSKRISNVNWMELDSSGGFEIQYSPNGNLFVNRGSEILYSSDNGINFSSIPLPEGQSPINYYHLEVLSDNILFLIGKYFGESYYTLNNGQNWIPAILSSSVQNYQVKLVDNYIIIAELEYSYVVTRINIISNEVTSEDLGEFYTRDYHGSVIQGDGTIYFQAFDTNGGHPDGLYRYRFGEGLEYIGQFQELRQISSLATSGTDLYGFGSQEYYLFDGDALKTYSYTGLPSTGNKRFLISENEYLYAILDNHSIFRSAVPLSYEQFIKGSIYNQVNHDCVPDASDRPLQYWQVKIEDNDYLRIKTSDSEGNFFFSVPDGQYKLSSHPINSNWELCASSFNINIDKNNTNANQDFLAKGLTECAELELDFSTPLLRRCVDNYYSIQVRNTGPQASDGTTLTLELDPYCDLISATIPHTQVNDKIIKFDLGILAVNDEISFKIFFTLSCDAPLGMEHCLVGILSDNNECGHSRSGYTECQENIGSYDPNDKRMFNESGKESATVDKDEYIYYHIRFQNTGTDTAFNIRVIDLLSPKLDLGTLEMLSASHPYNYIITDGPSLAVNFENILLPDSSTNEPASHGFFKFRIKPFHEYDYGTSIPNQAGIYFDFNDPVFTNEATIVIQKTIVPKEGINSIEFSVFPNPSNNILSLDISEGDFSRIEGYEIIDYLGQIVNQSAFSNSNVINIAHLTPGIYHLNLIENGNIIGMKKFCRL